MNETAFGFGRSQFAQRRRTADSPNRRTTVGPPPRVPTVRGRTATDDLRQALAARWLMRARIRGAPGKGGGERAQKGPPRVVRFAHLSEGSQ